MSLIDKFNSLTQEKIAWWLDDPKSFIDVLLRSESQILPNELSNFDRFWHGSSAEDKKTFTEHLRLLLSAIPERASGELIYVMGYLDPLKDDSHVTVLGPVLFTNEDSLRGFISRVKEEPLNKLHLTLGEKIVVKGEKEALKVVSSEIASLHVRLLMEAISSGGILPEPSYSGDMFLPHVTVGDSAVETGDEFSINRLSISLHPGARLNVENAYEIAGLRLS